MSFQILKRHWISCVNPETVDYDRYIGKFFRITRPDGSEFTIQAERIVGNITKPTNVEIWAKDQQYQVPLIDFYAQLDGKRASKEEIAFFEEMAFDVKANPNWRPGWAQRKGIWTPPNRKQ